MKKRFGALFLSFCLILGVFSGCGNGEAVETAATVSETASEAVQEPVTVRFLATGDNLIHSGIYQQAAARSTDGTYDFSFAYENIASYVAAADIAVINQETVVDPNKEPSTYPTFNSPAELGEEMVSLGFDVFNMANNHILDKGTSSVLAALDFWDSLGVLTCGAYRNDEDLNTVHMMEVKGVTFSFIGVTEHTNGISLPSDTDVRLIYTSNEELIQQQIEMAKEQSDVVVVNCHMGTEDSHVVTEAQQELYEKMVDWGADVIIGNHPHVLQKVEYMLKPDGGQALVIYSLGNLISTQSSAPNLIGGLMDFDVTYDFENETCSVTYANLIPIVTHYGSNKSNVQIYPLSDYTDTLASSHGIRSKYSGFSILYIEGVVSEYIEEQFLQPYRGD